MFNPGSLVRCKLLSGIYTPLGLIIRKANVAEYEVLVLRGRAGPKRQLVQAKDLEIVG